MTCYCLNLDLLSCVFGWLFVLMLVFACLTYLNNSGCLF